MTLCNFRKFRLSLFNRRTVTGEKLRPELSFTTFRSADNGGSQKNFALVVGIWCLFFKWRTHVGFAD